jgi:hypothetical protein
MAVQPLIHVGFGTPERQRRWTVAIRAILVIPHLLVVGLLGIAAFILTVFGWFAALVLGRLPAGIANFTAGWLAYALRVNSYEFLMHDEFPPFDGTRPFRVNAEIPITPVRRLAVFFRFLLVIPAGIVANISSAGLGVASPLIWLIVLVAGRMPVSLFSAVAAVLRFQLRTTAYTLMLTAKYPGELYGDAPQAPTFLMGPPGTPWPSGAPGAPAMPSPTAGGARAFEDAPLPPFVLGTPAPASPHPAPEPPAPADEQPWLSRPAPAPTYWEPGTPLPAPATTPASPPPPPPPGTSPSPPAPPSPPRPDAPAADYPPVPPPMTPVTPVTPVTTMMPPPAPPTTGRLVLSRPAKRIVTTFVIVGAFAQAASTSLEVALSGSSFSAYVDVVDAHNRLASTIDTDAAQRAACGASFECQTTYQGELADAFATFGVDVSHISFPSSAGTDVATLQSDTAKLVALLRQLEQDSPAQYAADLPTAEALGQTFDDDFATLAGDLA